MSSEIVEELHIRLRNELDRLGLSMAEAARRIDEEDSQGLRDVCSGRKRASAELVAKLATTGADVLYILTGVRSGVAPVLGVEEERAGYSVEVLSREEQALLDNYRHCPKDGQEAIKATSAAFAKSRGVKKGKAV